jgi:hypothetical protein
MRAHIYGQVLFEKPTWVRLSEVVVFSFPGYEVWHHPLALFRMRTDHSDLSMSNRGPGACRRHSTSQVHSSWAVPSSAAAEASLRDRDRRCVHSNNHHLRSFLQIHHTDRVWSPEKNHRTCCKARKHYAFHPGIHSTLLGIKGEWKHQPSAAARRHGWSRGSPRNFTRLVIDRVFFLVEACFQAFPTLHGQGGVSGCSFAW